jgi:poly(A) polymerase
MTKISADWLTAPATQKVCAALEQGGYQALFVGGCVRNALLGAPVSDLDISTDAHPDTVMQLAKAAGIKAIPTGIDHGTVTLVQDGIPHEVTTFRKDVETDGRRAVVAFADRIEDDAARRDFTMNALYAKSDGTVLDPLGGLPDLRARRFRFIGTAQDRIREDYLRSLRYFRFHAWYADPQSGFDAEALDAIAGNLDGLSQLSHERIGAEMLKLLAAPDPAPALATMRQTGVLGQILPGAEDRALAPLIHLEGDIKPDPLRRLTAIGGQDVPDALRLSKAQTNTLAQLRDGAMGAAPAAELAYRFGADHAHSMMLLRAAFFEQPLDPDTPDQIAQGAGTKFPIKAADLMADFQGPQLGKRIKQLEAAWIASGFALTKPELLALPLH